MATLLEKPEVLSTILFKGLYGDLAWPQWPNIVTTGGALSQKCVKTTENAISDGAITTLLL
jgi:hypothetical protein